MAKLSARGRHAVVEVTREYDEALLQRASDKHGFGVSLTVWERATRRLMSDGTILEKRNVRFRPSSPPVPWEDARGRLHSYGWKVHGKLKTGLTAADFARIYAAPRKDGSPSAWTVTTGAVVTPKVISQRRILAAVRSGESIGFCTACAAEQSGVEPDANGYRCEACGQMAVSGAENLLLEFA